MNVEWYPGHMTRALRQIRADLNLVDLIIEVRDARIPSSSGNPDIAGIGAGKMRLLVLSKADLSDPAANEEWTAHFRDKGTDAFFFSAEDHQSVRNLLLTVDRAGAPKRERDRKRGIRNRPVRAMILGIPNVGKSTLINRLSSKKKAKTGNLPGVTRGKQWIHVSDSLDLLDTPGILWPKFESEETGICLALTGAVSDERTDPEELAAELVRRLSHLYPSALPGAYGAGEFTDPKDVLREAAENRSVLLKGGEADTVRMAKIMLHDFRSGRLGRISLERPDLTGGER